MARRAATTVTDELVRVAGPGSGARDSRQRRVAGGDQNRDDAGGLGIHSEFGLLLNFKFLSLEVSWTAPAPGLPADRPGGPGPRKAATRSKDRNSH